MNKTWAIGDIHGCYDELMALYKKLLDAGLDPDTDVVVFMGDYMDRGPDSMKVVSQLIEWHKQYPQWVFLYGNHEDIFKNWLEGKQKYQEDAEWSCFLYNGGKETLKSYGLTEAVKWFPPEHIKFLLKETQLLYETDGFIFVHAGLIPGTSIEDTKKLMNKTISDALIWGREIFIDSDYDWGKKVIFGHTPAYKAQWGKFGQAIVMPNKIGIDGAACGTRIGSSLLAIELPVEKIHSQEAFI